MQKRNLCADNYLVVSCVLHNLQTCLWNGTKIVFGESGLDENGNGKQNCLQMLHGAYNIQNWREFDELRDIYLYVREKQGLEKKLKPLEEPILTRWWLVGDCAASFIDSFSFFFNMEKNLPKYTKINS